MGQLLILEPLSRLRHSAETDKILPTMEVPNRPLSFVPAKAGDIIAIGSMKLRVMEDGSNTDMIPVSHTKRNTYLSTIK